jgi:methionine salvage enolase-phosphatase E1
MKMNIKIETLYPYLKRKLSISFSKNCNRRKVKKITSNISDIISGAYVKENLVTLMEQFSLMQ